MVEHGRAEQFQRISFRVPQAGQEVEPHVSKHLDGGDLLLVGIVGGDVVRDFVCLVPVLIRVIHSVKRQPAGSHIRLVLPQPGMGHPLFQWSRVELASGFLPRQGFGSFFRLVSFRNAGFRFGEKLIPFVQILQVVFLFFGKFRYVGVAARLAASQCGHAQ